MKIQKLADDCELTTSEIKSLHKKAFDRLRKALEEEFECILHLLHYDEEDDFVLETESEYVKDMASGMFDDFFADEVENYLNQLESFNKLNKKKMNKIFCVKFKLNKKVLISEELVGVNQILAACKAADQDIEELTSNDIFDTWGDGHRNTPEFNYYPTWEEVLETQVFRENNKFVVTVYNEPLSLEEVLNYLTKTEGGNISLDSEKVARKLFGIWKSKGCPEKMEVSTLRISEQIWNLENVMENEEVVRLIIQSAAQLYKVLKESFKGLF